MADVYVEDGDERDASGTVQRDDGPALRGGGGRRRQRARQCLALFARAPRVCRRANAE